MIVGCLYIDAFEARAFRPESPLVVTNGRHIVATWGIPARYNLVGVTLAQARQLMPDARFVLRDRERERLYWEDVQASLLECTPFIAPSQPPNAFFRAADTEALWDLAGDLVVSIGTASHRHLAQLAALRAAPRNQLHIADAQAPAFLRSTPVGLLPRLGMDPEMAERLVLFGLTSLFDVSTLTQRQLRAQFGREGDRLYRFLHEKDDRIGLFIPPPAIRVAYAFEPEDSVRAVRPVLEHLISQARTELERIRPCRLCLEFCEHGGQWERVERTLFRPLADVESLGPLVYTLAAHLFLAPRELDEIALVMGGLRHPAAHQVDLFSRRAPVMNAIRDVHRRKPDAIKRAVVNTGALFPEERFRYESFA